MSDFVLRLLKEGPYVDIKKRKCEKKKKNQFTMTVILNTPIRDWSLITGKGGGGK